MNLIPRGCLHLLSLLSCLSFSPKSVAVEPDPRAKAKIAALEKLLPECEQAAAQAETALAPRLEATQPNVIAAVDGVRLRVDCVRSLRADSLIESLMPAWRHSR